MPTRSQRKYVPKTTLGDLVVDTYEFLSRSNPVSLAGPTIYAKNEQSY